MTQRKKEQVRLAPCVKRVSHPQWEILYSTGGGHATPTRSAEMHLLLIA